MGIFKELRKYDPKKLKIRINSRWTKVSYNIGGDDIIGKLNWWRYTFRLVQHMTNLRFFNLVGWTSDRTQFDDKRRVQDYIKPLKNPNLKEIVLAGMERFINDSATVYKYFLGAPAIENVAIRIKPEMSQPISEAIANVKHLKNLIIPGHMEISEIFLIAKTRPELSKIQMDYWHHEIEDVPIDSLTQGLQLQNITHLHLDHYLKIEVKED